ncbi:hypothetical protein EBN03_32585 [Nocardia stercoris]|uniref:Uncharacterized protein n=1 Tax=Nocardia stercoris TaxID=2483361 RepID=A0A3M2KT86_9NOCA|nr:hypothetical protein EBN03_32585 [Nocardia stercoris]
MPGPHTGGVNPAEFADPAQVRAEVGALLAELKAVAAPERDVHWTQGSTAETDSARAGVDITRKAKILEQAHDVLVHALATVDKI